MTNSRSALAAAGALFCFASPAVANQSFDFVGKATVSTTAPAMMQEVALDDRLQILYDCACNAAGGFDGAIDFGASNFAAPSGPGDFGGMGSMGLGGDAGRGDGGAAAPSLSNADLQPQSDLWVPPNPLVVPDIATPPDSKDTAFDHAYEQGKDILDDVGDLFGEGTGWVGPTWDLVTCPGIMPITPKRPGNAKAGVYFDGDSAGVCYSGATQ